MLRVVELFSGIGSQIKALINIDAKFEVVATVEWDIHAAIAYDLIHNGPQDSYVIKETQDEMISFLEQFTFSNDGKKPLEKKRIRTFNNDLIKSLFIAVKRSKNLVSILDVNAMNFPKDVDILTYSFPCQDLSISGFWHGNKGGIDRNTENRSNMLWQVERILNELEQKGEKLPRFLLMENVNSILSKLHIDNFNEWLNELKRLGYYNKIYTLNANNFNNPQKRVRTFLISVHSKNKHEESLIENYFDSNNLESFRANCNYKIEQFLKLDYSKTNYYKEALQGQPNDTMSRRKILSQNVHLFDGKNIKRNSISTITTKQDRHPNSGVVIFNEGVKEKSKFRYLTPRECFLFMGFQENDFDSVLNGDIKINKRYSLFSQDKLIKLAGNSIVVNVLEKVFEQIVEIDQLIKKT